MVGEGEEGKDETFGESNMETYITICKIDSQQEFSVGLRELKQGLWKNLEGGLGRELGGRFKREGHMYTYSSLTLIFGRKLQNSVKQLSFT